MTEATTGVQLPPSFRSVEIADDEGRAFRLVVGAKPGPYERAMIAARPFSEIARLLIRLLQGGGTLVDLGANIGTVSLPVAVTGSRVIAVELLPQNVERLRWAARLNGLQQFRIIEAAATDTDGWVPIAGEEAWGHVLGSQAKWPWISWFRRRRLAKGLRLDTILAMINAEAPNFIESPVVMKVDVEGHELEALRGAESLLSGHRPAMIFESIQPANEPPGKAELLKRFVADHGYAMYMIRGRILSPHQPADIQIGLISDILAIPRERDAHLARSAPDYELRPLSRAEQLHWLEEMENAEELHRRHAAAIRAMPGSP